MADIFEILMIVAFGASWPFNIVKAYKARTTKGTSLLFTLLIFFGYVAGIISKIIRNNWAFLPTLAFVFYCVNLAMLTCALLIYFRNTKLDKSNASDGSQNLHGEPKEELPQ